jgi:hypothetical protein
MRRRLGIPARLLLAALLVIPLLAHAHGHRSADAMASPCTVCVVAHHTPAMQPAGTNAPALLLLATSLAAVASTPPSRSEARAYTERGPPAPRSAQVA